MTNNNTDIQVSSEPGGMLHEMPMVVELGELFGVPGKSLIKLLQTQIIKVPKDSPPATPGELLYTLSVMRQYRLNPMLKQVHAWRDKRGDLCVMPGVDGWVKYAMERPTHQRVDYAYGPMIPSPDGKGKSCWEWMQATVVDTERGNIVCPPVFLDEWYQGQGQYGPGPWQKQTRHKLTVVTYRLAIRMAYGMGGLDVRDPEDFQAAPYHKAEATMADAVDSMAARLNEAKSEWVVGAEGQKILNTVANGAPVAPVIVEDSFWTCPVCETENDGAECVRCGAPLLPADEAEPMEEPLAAPTPSAQQAGTCAVVGCVTAWSLRCASCGERFCTGHMGESRIKCLVCGGGA